VTPGTIGRVGGSPGVGAMFAAVAGSFSIGWAFVDLIEKEETAT
jgi:hypothetical protein